MHPVAKPKPLEWISTKKLFHRAMQELFIEGVVHDLPDARLAARRWICDVALQKPELMWKYLTSDQEGDAKLKQVQIDAILSKTAQEAELHSKKNKSLELDIALKEKELNQNEPVEVDNATLDQLMHKMVALDKSTAKKLRKIHQAKNIEDDD